MRFLSGNIKFIVIRPVWKGNFIVGGCIARGFDLLGSCGTGIACHFHSYFFFEGAVTCQLSEIIINTVLFE